MRRPAPRPIAAAVRSLGRELAPQSPLGAVQSVWEAAVGAQIAAHCVPARERGGTLTVDCEAAVWAAEMEMRSTEVLESLNRRLPDSGRLSGIRFRVS